MTSSNPIVANAIKAMNRDESQQRFNVGDRVRYFFVVTEHGDGSREGEEVVGTIEKVERRGRVIYYSIYSKHGYDSYVRDTESRKMRKA